MPATNPMTASPSTAPVIHVQRVLVFSADSAAKPTSAKSTLVSIAERLF
jgi:hypothetical protein